DGRDAFARRHAGEPAGGAKDDRDQVGDAEADAREAGDRGERVRRDERDTEAEGRGPGRAADHTLVAEARHEGVAGEASGGHGERERGEAERRGGARRAERALEIDGAPVAHGALAEEPEEGDEAEADDGAGRPRETSVVAGDVGARRKE